MRVHCLRRWKAKKRKEPTKRKSGPHASVSPYLYGCVQPRRAAALSIPLESAMCSELAKGSSACEERKHSSYFWTQHHRSPSQSELRFLIIRNQKWERREKTSLAPPEAYPRGRIGSKALALFIPSLSWRGAITAKLTEAKEDAVAGNVFVPKIPHWLSKRERTERMPAQGPDVAPWGHVVPCSLSIGWGPAIKASASSRCGQKGTFQRSWLSKQTWLKQQNLQEGKQGWL